jgi:hypothetical protein
MPTAYQYRITKFDPANRNAEGHHIADEWYLHSQIGMTFGGVLLTGEEYLRVESAYIATAVDFHREAGLPDIFAIGVEDHRLKGAPAEGTLISAELLPTLCRAMLRERYWCRIVGEDFFIHFGYDFYMYLGAATPCEQALGYARSRGLFPEPFISPYHPENE